jgi:hypothetical protein
MSDTRGDQLDALNRATFRRHYRNIVDNGIGDPDRYPHSALPGVLADLRANAEQVYGDAAPSRHRPAVS